MANNKNLKPLEPNSERTKEIAKKGGTASGAARREKKTIRDTMDTLLDSPLSGDELVMLEEYGIVGVDATRRAVLSVSLYKRAIDGDLKAFDLLTEIIKEKGQTQQDKEDAEKFQRQLNKELSFDSSRSDG